MTDSDINIKKAVRTALAMNEMTQSELAEAIGVSTGMVSQYLSGKRNVSMKRIKDIAKAFDMKVSELLALGE